MRLKVARHFARTEPMRCIKKIKRRSPAREKKNKTVVSGRQTDR